MKPYKLKRKQEAHRKKNPTRFNRKQWLIAMTKKIALDVFNRNHSYDWTWSPGTPLDSFGSDMYYEAEGEFNLQYGDVELMFPLYLKCEKVLEDNKKKSEYIQKIYVPFEEDLFSIV